MVWHGGVTGNTLTRHSEEPCGTVRGFDVRFFRLGPKADDDDIQDRSLPIAHSYRRGSDTVPSRYRRGSDTVPSRYRRNFQT